MFEIAFGIDDALMGVSLLSGLGGLFRKRGPDPRMLYLNQLANDLASQQNQLVSADRRNLLGLTGAGGDAVAALGRRLGSSLAGSGVYNSSATAGAITQGNRDLQTQLSNLAQQNFQNELAQQASNQRYLTSQRLGIAEQDVNYDRQQRAGTIAGITNLLGQIAKRYGGGRGVAGGDAGRTYGDYTNGMQGGLLDMTPLNPSWDINWGGYGQTPGIPRFRIPANPYSLGAGQAVG